MRAGIVGEITAYTEGGVESHGLGLESDAQNASRVYPEFTIRFRRQDGNIQWFEAGKEIPEPEWADPTW